jgi:hypothetical protein
VARSPHGLLVVFAFLSACAVAEAPSFEIVALRLDTISEISFEPDAGTLDDDGLVARWDLDGDGAFEIEGPLEPVSRRFLQPQDVTVRFELSSPAGELLHEGSTLLSIEHPDRWPRLVPTYFIGGFTEDEVDAVLDDPGSARALMVAGFDLWQSIAQEDDGSWTVPVRRERIDAIHEAGLLAYVDVARGWAPQEFWSDWDALAAWLVELAEAGIDGVDFDEFGGQLDADELNELQDELWEVNPHLRLIVTQVYGSDLEELLEDGATPDYVALAWYLAGGSGFETCLELADDYGPRCAYWVDPSTFDRIEQTYDEADAVLMWNLCWRPSTCVEQPQNTWVPWEEVRPLLSGLDGFEQP